MARTSPGGVGDGLPSMPNGEPLLQRWFVIPMIVLVLVGIGVSIWMVVVVLTRPQIPVAERRPPGTATVTHDRGQAVLNETRESAAGPDCAEEVELFGDPGARETGAAALRAVCGLLGTGEFPEAEEGLRRWIEAGAQLRVAVFELTGVESSARVETIPDSDVEQVVIELNPRFQFEPGFRAAPMILHELAHLAHDWPGQAVTAEQERDAMLVQHRACQALRFDTDPPRGCLDAALLAEDVGAVESLVDAGYRRGP